MTRSYDHYAALPGYRAGHVRIAASKSLARLRHELDHPSSGDTLSRRALRAVHSAVLEPDTYNDIYAVYEGRRAGKEYDRWCADRPGMEVLRAEEHQTAQGMAAAVRAHPVAGPLLMGDGGKSETCLTWDASGLPCKALIDRLTADGDVLDLKSVANCDVRAVSRLMYQHGWHLQLAHYWNAAGNPNARVGIVAVETAAPHELVVLWLSPEALADAVTEWRRTIDRIAEAEASGVWPSRYDDEQVMELPSWRHDEIADEDF